MKRLFKLEILHLLDQVSRSRFNALQSLLLNLISLLDTCISSNWWMNNIVSKINSYLTQCDSPYEHVRRRSEAIIEQEINLSLHLGINYILFDLPKSDKIDNFAATINRYMANPCSH